MVKPSHNTAVAGKAFKTLDAALRREILSYEFSVQILPTQTEDREVLQIFARLNSTGVRLNAQELRNAEYFGVYKQLMYAFAYEQLERWRSWRVFNEDAIARMREVELVSDLALSFLQGMSGKSQPAISRLYRQFDETFSERDVLLERFRAVFDAVEETLHRPGVRDTVFRNEVLFFSLAAYLYDRMYGLGSPLLHVTAARLPRGLTACLLAASRELQAGEAHPRVMDAIGRAPVDVGRRRIRHEYLSALCDGAAGD